MNTENSQKSNNVITVKNLVAHYGERKILNKVSMSVKDGEIMIVMGGSGSGKSTILRHMLALETPTSGHISLLGQDLTTCNYNKLQNLRRKMGVAFQGGALFGSLTVGENVMLPLREHTNLDEKTMKIMSRMKLEVVNLAGFEDLMPSELSGGMIKRVALARAIVMDPKLLFFDEPSAGLDPVAAVELDELILQLRTAMNMTIVVVTHELESAYKIADRITVLDQGDILISNAVEIVKNSDNERIQDLLHRRARKENTDHETYLNRLTH
ncbi:MAG: ABC transporter ATP-binding protein [Thiohalomonadales bacterium]